MNRVLGMPQPQKKTIYIHQRPQAKTRDLHLPKRLSWSDEMGPGKPVIGWNGVPRSGVVTPVTHFYEAFYRGYSSGPSCMKPSQEEYSN